MPGGKINKLGAISHVSGKYSVHYGWVIVFAGVLNFIASLGIGRFALGMLLPSMSHGLLLSKSQMGAISSGNFAGYLLGVLICGFLVRRLGARRVVLSGLLAVGATMTLVGFLDNYLAVLICYLLTGIASGLANIAMLSLIPHWFSPAIRGRAAGIMVTGNGLGIILSGWLIPLLNAGNESSDWRLGWLILGIGVLLIALVCGYFLKNNPAMMSLGPLEATTAAKHRETTTQVSAAPEALWKATLYLGSIYFLFGFTYVIYATFIVTTLIQKMGYTEAVAGSLWIWVGFFSLFSGPIFGGLSDRIGRRASILIVLALQTCAHLLIGLQTTEACIFLSIALFGISVWSIPSILTAAISDYLPREKVTRGMGHITFMGGAGQLFGPALAGLLADGSGNFSISYLMAAAVSSMAILLVLILHPKQQQLTT